MPDALVRMDALWAVFIARPLKQYFVHVRRCRHVVARLALHPWRFRIRRKTYRTRDEARQDLFDEMEMFRKPRRTHVRSGMLSPAVSGRQHDIQPDRVYETRDHSNR